MWKRRSTPRFQNGFHTDFDTTGDVRGNGQQYYGRETVSGGDCNWGYRFSYGARLGSNYQAGNGETIPSAYQSRDFLGELGRNVSPDQRFEFAYQLLDQTNTAYPCQFFDINTLQTYGLRGRYIDENPTAPWSKLVVGGWYNFTAFNGDTAQKNNPNFPVMQRVDYALDEEFHAPLEPTAPYGTYLLNGSTVGATSSSGMRAIMTFGDKDCTQLKTGADFRYLGQVINEYYDTQSTNAALYPVPPGLANFYTNMPQSWMANPGVFAELSRPLTDRWTATIGARADFVQTMAQASDLRTTTNPDGTVSYAGSLPGIPTDLSNTNVLQQDDALVSFYATNTYKVTDCWTIGGGFGEAQRPPTLVERYADGLFISALQSGFTRVIGDPSLAPERNWQFDLSLAAAYPRWRFRLSGFCALVQDYVTFEGENVQLPPPPFDAYLVQFTNTPLATLAGFEMQQEYDLTSQLTPFVKTAYVDGRDQTIQAPLPAMPPFEGTVGLRYHDPEKQRWGIEMETRMVAIQDRLGTIRVQGSDELFVAEERTPGFTVWNLRCYYNCTKNFHLIAGIDNLLNRNYQEHLDLRLFGPPGTPLGSTVTRVLEPGMSPHFGLNWVF